MDTGGGILLGIACVLKLFPGLFVVYLILQKKWKALLSMIITIVITMLLTIEVIGINDVLHFFTTVITKDSSFWIAYPLNLSLESTVYFLFIGGEQVIPLIHSRLLALLIISILDFALLALLIWQIHKLPSTPLGNDLAYNAVIIVMLLLSPIIWQHIYPILLLILILLLKLFLEEKERIYLRIGVISFLLLSLPIHELLPFITNIIGSDRIPWYAALMLQVPIAGVLLLWFSIWFITRRSKNLYVQVQDN